MADVTYYVALPVFQDDIGKLVAGTAEECQSATTALRRAEMMSRISGSIGAVAFSRTGDPMMGEFGDAHLLRKFGNAGRSERAVDASLRATGSRECAPDGSQ